MDLEYAADLVEASDDCQLEGMYYVANEAYENKKGEPMPFSETQNCPITGTLWTEEELPNRYASIWNRFTK